MVFGWGKKPVESSIESSQERKSTNQNISLDDVPKIISVMLLPTVTAPKEFGVINHCTLLEAPVLPKGKVFAPAVVFVLKNVGTCAIPFK